MSKISSMARLRLLSAMADEELESANISPTTNATCEMSRRRSKSSSRLLERFSKKNYLFSKFVTVKNFFIKIIKKKSNLIKNFLINFF